MKNFDILVFIFAIGITKIKAENCFFGSVAEGNCRTLSGFISGVTGSDIYCKELFISNKRVLTNPKSIQPGTQDASPAEFPHMAALGYEDGNGTVWECAGVLISREHVLTAAQCLTRRVKLVRLGDSAPSSPRQIPTRQEFTVKQQIKHPEYKAGSFSNDLGILVLSSEAITTNEVISSCLNAKRDIGDEIFSLSGWGTPESPVLKKTAVKVLKECGGIDEDKQFCAKGIKTDVCKGDIGGAMQKSTNKGYVTFGIVSVGNDCGKTDAPPVFTRISKYLTWIKSIITN